MFFKNIGITLLICLAVIVTINLNNSHAELSGEARVTPSKNPDYSVEMFEDVELIGSNTVSHMDKMEIIDYVTNYIESCEKWIFLVSQKKSDREKDWADFYSFIKNSSDISAFTNYNKYLNFRQKIHLKYNMVPENIKKIDLLSIWFYPELIDWKSPERSLKSSKGERFEASVLYKITNSKGEEKVKSATIAVRRSSFPQHQELEIVPFITKHFSIIDYPINNLLPEINDNDGKSFIAPSVGKYFAGMLESMNKNNSHIIWPQLRGLLTESIKEKKNYKEKRYTNKYSTPIYIKDVELVSTKNNISNIRLYLDTLIPDSKELEEAVAELKIDLNDVSDKSSFADIINNGKVLEYSVNKVAAENQN
ncbi:MAG: hypothetical protein PQ612_07745 [Rickettsiales bacterium]|nr:hypothetical protein [Pseudomonadota bacterium]MDA0966980.1 hypothetical protein [Pseudomonadota bacterium]MDG4543900.1 hypothetical protein [Rickettsiales bacterium]MDG4546046.1 hypothetical protein [Rickettsiales bacterium]MDG4548292.1 hypothetical protein [Rickettsiales bacterium]